MKYKDKELKVLRENVLAVLLALLGLAFVTAVVGMMLSQEPDIRPIPIYVTNPADK